MAKAFGVAGTNCFGTGERQAIWTRYFCISRQESSKMLVIKVLLVKSTEIAVYHASDFGFVDEFGNFYLGIFFHIS